MPSIRFFPGSSNEYDLPAQWIAGRESDLSEKGWSGFDSADAELTVFDRFDSASRKILRKTVGAGNRAVYHFHPSELSCRMKKGEPVCSSGQIRALKKMLAAAPTVTAPTEASCRFLETLMPGMKAVLLPESETLPPLKYDSKAARAFRMAFGFSESDKLILSAEPCTEAGGITELAELARSFPELHFLRFGELRLMEMSGKVRKTVLNELPNLHVMGEMPREVLQGAFSSADAFLSLSRFEFTSSYAALADSMGIYLLLRDGKPFRESFPKGESCHYFHTVEELSALLEESKETFPKHPSRPQTPSSLNDLYRSLLK